MESKEATATEATGEQYDPTEMLPGNIYVLNINVKLCKSITVKHEIKHQPKALNSVAYF